MAAIARVLHVILLALWLGAGVFFIGVIAPDTFQIVEARQMAGELVRKVLEHFDLFGLVAGPIVFVTLFLGWVPLGVRLRLRAVGALIMTVMVGVSGRWLSPKMVELLAAMGRPIDDVDAGDPLMVQFTNLHTASEAIMTAHVALALALLVASVLSATPKPKFGIEL